MYKDIAITIILIFSVITSIQASNDFGITMDIYKDICGIWDLYPEVCNFEDSFSWGKAKIAVNWSIIIELGEERPFITLGGMGEYDIKRVSKKNNNYVIQIISSNNNKEYNIELSVINNNSIVFKEDKNLPFVFKDLQGNYKYKKISGPIIKYYKPNVNSLRLRSKASTNSNILNMLNQRDKLIILKKGKEEKIEDLKGRWVRVLTTNNDIGWCFDSYLEVY